VPSDARRSIRTCVLIKEEWLADEITELASHIHAPTCRWLGLVAEFDRRGGWSDWGCRSCAHWVSWRCGIALVSARSICESRTGSSSCR